ncbi:MAG TPA: DUF11 domain-containing protein, partial [Methanosarcinales archaeon]|nr:DUF11 domain-containing protein [Methanosarcinales archaeon]
MRKIGMFVRILIIIVFAELSSNVQAQSDDGLVAEWHFDEGSGNIVKDTSGNGNDGVIHGASWVDGKFGKALSFDGKDDYVSISGVPNLGTVHTFSFWLKPSDTSRGNIIFRKDWCINGGGGGWRIFRTSDSSFQYSYQETDGVTDRHYGVGISTPVNTWTHVIIVRDGSTLKGYANGVHSVSVSITSSAEDDSSDAVFIGRQDWICGANYFFHGILDEVRIYNRALSAEEIKAHYEGGQTALTITKTASSHSIKQEQTTTITLTVKNTGTTEIKDIEVADTIPHDLIFVGGETSKKYASLKPKDSREFQYILQTKEAGTFNLDPATATYADEKGNYYTAKSNNAKIEVIPSLIATPIPTLIQTPTPTPIHTSNLPTATVHLYGEKTDVVLGEDILLRLAAVNLITKPIMTVQVIIIPPSGMSVTSTGFVKSGVGLYTSTYTLQPGDGKNIEVSIKANQVGDFEVKGSIVYYFGEDKEKAEYRELKLQIKVRQKIEKTPIHTLPLPTPQKTPGFTALMAFIILTLLILFK